jgi:hypothetical protein
MTDQATHVARPVKGGDVVFYLAKSDSPTKFVWIVHGTAEEC